MIRRTSATYWIQSKRKIERFLGEARCEEFIANDMMISAVTRELEIIGEAVNNLSDAFKRKHATIPFRDISDMRNFLIHEYFGVNTKIIWETCTQDIPTLKRELESIE